MTASVLIDFLEEFDDDAPVVLQLGGQFDTLDPKGLGEVSMGEDSNAVFLNAHPIDLDNLP